MGGTRIFNKHTRSKPDLTRFSWEKKAYVLGNNLSIFVKNAEKLRKVPTEFYTKIGL